MSSTCATVVSVSCTASYDTDPIDEQSVPEPSSITIRWRNIGSASRTAAIRGANWAS